MKYFIRNKGENNYREVDKETYVDAERADGFRNTLGKPNEPATSAFGGTFYEGYTEFESLADFNVPQDRKAIGYALGPPDWEQGGKVEILLIEEE